jgi:hypothetical protein
MLWSVCICNRAFTVPRMRDGAGNRDGSIWSCRGTWIPLVMMRLQMRWAVGVARLMSRPHAGGVGRPVWHSEHTLHNKRQRPLQGPQSQADNAINVRRHTYFSCGKGIVGTCVYGCACAGKKGRRGGRGPQMILQCRQMLSPSSVVLKRPTCGNMVCRPHTATNAGPLGRRMVCTRPHSPVRPPGGIAIT